MVKFLLACIPLDFVLELIHLLLLNVQLTIEPETCKEIAPPTFMAILSVKVQLSIRPFPVKRTPPPALATLFIKVEPVNLPVTPPQKTPPPSPKAALLIKTQ